MIEWKNEEIAQLARNLASKGTQYREAITNIYKSINSLGQKAIWTGSNYNVVAKAMNGVINNFRSNSVYLQQTIPQTIYNIAASQAANGGGELPGMYFHSDSENILPVEETVVNSSGDQKINIDSVKETIARDFNSYCESAFAVIGEYYDTFGQVSSISTDAAIQYMYEELNTILGNTRKYLQDFETEIHEVAGKSVQNIELTNEEAMNYARRLQQ